MTHPMCFPAVPSFLGPTLYNIIIYPVFMNTSHIWHSAGNSIISIIYMFHCIFRLLHFSLIFFYMWTLIWLGVSGDNDFAWQLSFGFQALSAFLSRPWEPESISASQHHISWRILQNIRLRLSVSVAYNISRGVDHEAVLNSTLRNNFNH